ncbi:MAG: hypothetical protein WBK77_06210 [Alphaproteobacteria bacterium]
MRLKMGLMLLAGTLTLTGCVSREQADQRLQNGCTAGAELFMEEGHKIKEVKDHIFRDNPDLGPGYREVRLTVVDTDGWYDADKEIQCIFVETYGIFGSSHTATIYQLKMDEKIWGMQGKEILGTMEEHLKLTETVEQGLNRK